MFGLFNVFSLLNFSFCSCIIFLILLNCQSVSSCSSLNFRTVILDSLSGSLWISISLGSVTGSLLIPLVVSCFPTHRDLCNLVLCVCASEEGVTSFRFYGLIFSKEKTSPVSQGMLVHAVALGLVV